MFLLDREMKVTKQISEKSNNSLYCQASLNSDGVITLRNYNIENKDSNEIIILSAEETQAIFGLMRTIKKHFPDLPFLYGVFLCFQIRIPIMGASYDLFPAGIPFVLFMCAVWNLFYRGAYGSINKYIITVMGLSLWGIIYLKCRRTDTL